MNAPNDNTPQSGLRDWWLSPPRSGLRRFIAPWEYRHLRAWAGIRITSAIILVSLAFVTLALGGNDQKTYEFTAVFLAAALAHSLFAYWELTIARSAIARS